MKISNYTIPELNKFKELCNFTQDEMSYFELKTKDESNVHIALTLCISEAKVSKLASIVKDKMHRVEKYIENV